MGDALTAREAEGLAPQLLLAVTEIFPLELSGVAMMELEEEEPVQPEGKDQV